MSVLQTKDDRRQFLPVIGPDAPLLLADSTGLRYPQENRRSVVATRAVWLAWQGAIAYSSPDEEGLGQDGLDEDLRGRLGEALEHRDVAPNATDAARFRETLEDASAQTEKTLKENRRYLAEAKDSAEARNNRRAARQSLQYRERLGIARAFDDYVKSLRFSGIDVGWDAIPAAARDAAIAGWTYQSLALRMTALAIALTRVWAESLAQSPEPLMTGFGNAWATDSWSEETLSLWHCTDERFAEVFAALTALMPESGSEPCSSTERTALALMCRLVRLFFETALDESFWTGRNRPAISAAMAFYDRQTAPVKCLIGAPLEPTGPALRGKSRGIGQRHLEWLNTSIRHLLLDSSGAHRSRDELALALSLAPPSDDGRDCFWVRRPKLAEAPGLGGAKRDETQTILVDTLMESYSADVSPLYSTLARVLAHTARECSDGSPVVALSFCYDLELEKALEQEGPYRVLVPVTLPVLGPQHLPAHAGPTMPGWLLGFFPGVGDTGADVQSPPVWIRLAHKNQLTQTSSTDYGPIVVKLTGSPLHRVDRPIGQMDPAQPLAVRSVASVFRLPMTEGEVWQVRDPARGVYDFPSEADVKTRSLDYSAKAGHRVVLGELDFLGVLSEDGLWLPPVDGLSELVEKKEKKHLLGLDLREAADRLEAFGLVARASSGLEYQPAALMPDASWPDLRPMRMARLGSLQDFAASLFHDAKELRTVAP